MQYRKRTYYTDSQKALMRNRWRRGESLQQIAQLFDRNHSSAQRILALSGGIRPPGRRRSARALHTECLRPILRSAMSSASVSTAWIVQAQAHG